MGYNEKIILEDFSELTSEDIRACLYFAADREKKLFISSPQTISHGRRSHIAGNKP